MTPFVFFLMQFDTDMNQALLARSDLYLHAMRKQFPLRDIKTEVVNINGKLVFITSYFKKLEPPRELCQGTDIEQMVRAKLSLLDGKALNVLRDFIFVLFSAESRALRVAHPVRVRHRLLRKLRRHLEHV